MTAELGTLLSAWWTIPFAGMLLSIALLPLLTPHLWHHHYPKVTLFWSLALVIPLLYVHRSEAQHHLLEVAITEYLPFILILWALYITASGILVAGTLSGSPLQNTLLLAFGCAIASWVGTTGASVVLIRPVIRAIEERKHRAHTIVFFIFLVSNMGGLLTPLGDPPLFLGFLKGVPFFWTMHLYPMMLLVALPLLAIYFAMDTIYYRREPHVSHLPTRERIRIYGWTNVAYLALVVLAVFMSGTVDLGAVNVLGVECTTASLVRDAVLALIGWIALRTTPKQIHGENRFSWGPIREVVILFAGVFVTMIPAIAILRAGENGALRPLIETAREPHHYFWLAGGLSSFLDNAPTYLTFFNTALGALEPGKPETEALRHLLGTHAQYLRAISCGAVFMGANTYIGNAPNFMVKSIAEEAGIQMPSFFGYMLKYSIPVLIPLFLVVTFVLFP